MSFMKHYLILGCHSLTLSQGVTITNDQLRNIQARVCSCKEEGLKRKKKFNLYIKTVTLLRNYKHILIDAVPGLSYRHKCLSLLFMLKLKLFQ